jgi:hypothetical protein
MVLYVFITHRNNIENCYDRIVHMMKDDFVVVQGGALRDTYDTEKRILSLNCNDKYVGLPEKVMKTFHFLSTDENFSQYTHFTKLDDDMVVSKRFGSLDDDYIGNVHHVDGNRQWHIGRCGNFWDKIPYIGEFSPWCMGGFGYLVSRKALELICPDHNYLDHIYEDVYIGLLMNKVGIEPKNINIKEYLVSPEH